MSENEETELTPILSPEDVEEEKETTKEEERQVCTHSNFQ